MFHHTKLPPITKRRLTVAMNWQFRLLRWAAEADEVDQNSLQRWLSDQRKFRGREVEIARWVWNSEKRYSPLRRFAREAGPRAEKVAWVDAKQEEAIRLLRRPSGQFTTFSERGAPEWQKQAAQFFVQFYEDFRKTSLPACLFREASATRFTAQDFLTAFLSENQTLCVCPVCDSSAFFTVVRDSIFTDIDHYLPKSHYPNLAIHPYNLVPLCHNCNSGTKGDRDPLQAGQRMLEDIWLPYRDAVGLSSAVLLDVQVRDNTTTFEGLRIQQGKQLRQQLHVLSEIYEIPQRWRERQDEIGEKLFRRMRHYLRSFPVGEEAFSGEATNYLDELLSMLHDEDLAREPYAIPMIWWLARMITEELSQDGAPLTEEIRHWVQELSSRAALMQSRGREIRAKL